MPLTYTLILNLEKGKEMEVGSLGKIKFKKGWYAYTGSGEKRIERHKALSSGKRKTRKWHIDWLLPSSKIMDVVKSRGKECEVASRIGEFLEPVKGFGCTDCGCYTHLHYSPTYKRMKKAVSIAHLSIKSRFPRDLLNEIKWKGFGLEKCKIWYLHRGAPADRKLVEGGEITELGKKFFYIQEKMIPYHRIQEIWWDDFLIWC